MDIDQYYYDCAFQVVDVYDRRFSSGFTSYGIKCIDSEYCRRIQNIGNPVIQLIKIERTHHYKDGNYYADYWDEYTELPLDQDFYSCNRSAFCYNKNNFADIKMPKDFKSIRPYQKVRLIATEYTYTHPTYSAKHKGEDPNMLRDEIIKNPNLHQLIKDNLLGNLENYLKH